MQLPSPQLGADRSFFFSFNAISIDTAESNDNDRKSVIGMARIFQR